MCGFCIELAALSYYTELLDEQLPVHFHTEMIRLRRSTLASPAGVDRPPEIVALNFFFREGRPFYSAAPPRTFTLPTLRGKTAFLIDTAFPTRALAVLHSWYEAELSGRNPDELFDCHDLEMAYQALLLSTHLQRTADPAWLSLIERLSSQWTTLPSHVTGMAQPLEAGRASPFQNDTRLWLRREARRALSLAGRQEMAAQHDEDEPHPVLSLWQSLDTSPQ